MMENIKVKVYNSGAVTDIKNFEGNFTCCITEDQTKVAAIALFCKAIAKNILSDLENVLNNNNAFGAFVAIPAFVPEEVLRMNAIAKLNYELMEMIITTPYFVPSSIVTKNDEYVVVKRKAFELVMKHCGDVIEAANKLETGLWYKGITVLYTDADRKILIPTSVLEKRYGGYEELYFCDHKNNNNIQLSNYNDTMSSVVAATFMLSAVLPIAAEVDEFVAKAVEDKVIVEKSLDKAIGTWLLDKVTTEED